MASDKQIEANRLNAQKSTVPRSLKGHTCSRFNALKSGIHAQSILLPGEDPAALESLRTEYYDHHQPITPDECDTPGAIIHAVETKLVQHELANTPNLDPSAPLGHIFSNANHKFIHLQSRMNSAERSFHRNQDRLERPNLKSQRPPIADKPAPAPQPIETTPPNPKLASFPETPPKPQPVIPIPEHHPPEAQGCPHYRKVGVITLKCPYLRQDHGSRFPATPPGRLPRPPLHPQTAVAQAFLPVFLTFCIWPATVRGAILSASL